MLVLTPAYLTQINQHSEETYPYECCGILLGLFQAPKRIVQQVCRIPNLNQTRQDRYEMDPQQRLIVEQSATQKGLEVIGFYHSHPDHDAYFSQTDLEGSEEYRFGEPWLPSTYSYLVVSVQKGKSVLCKSFIVQAGQSFEEEVLIQ